jgi:CBS domain-containing protein
MKIEELMNRFPATCGPDETLIEAEQKMQNSNCAFLPVTAGEGSQFLVGMITDGDISMAAQLWGRSLKELRVKDAMARQLRMCHPGDSLGEAEAIMREAGILQLPVVDESNRLLGVLSLGDVAREAEREREAPGAPITAVELVSAVSSIRKPHRVGRRAQVAGPIRVLESSGERQAGAT